MSTKNNYGVKKVNQPRFEFPAPPEGEGWHNPERLSAEQVGEGSRLLTYSEAIELSRLGKKQLKRLKIEVCFCAGSPDGYWSDAEFVKVDYTYRLPAETPFSWQREYNPNKFYGHINQNGDRRMFVSGQHDQFTLTGNPSSSNYKHWTTWEMWQDACRAGSGQTLEFDTLLELAEWVSGK